MTELASLIAAQTLAGRFDHLLVFRIFDSLFDQLLSESLLISSRNRWGFMTHRFRDRLPPTFLRQLLSGGRLGHQAFLARQFLPRLLEIRVEDLMGRTPVNKS